MSAAAPPHRFDALEAHRDHHYALHLSFSELVRDYLIHHPGKLLTHVSVDALVRWSYQQTIRPVDGKAQP